MTTRERLSDLAPTEVEVVLDEMRSCAREYGGRIKILGMDNIRFMGSEVILLPDVCDEYIPTTSQEVLTTLPHVRSMRKCSGLYRSVDGRSRLTVKASYAADLVDDVPADDTEVERALQTLNMHAFYRFVWDKDAVYQAMVRGGHSVSTRPLGYQKNIVKTLDPATDTISETELRWMTEAEHVTGDTEFFETVEREVELQELRDSLANHTMLLMGLEIERALKTEDPIDLAYRNLLGQ
ncbi:MAG: hypothetical protein WBP12_05220 [Candidatus Saccharimonas sp.]